ncbi:MAG: hypothetical protein ACSHWY_02595 [Octadecabacter sp.]
MTASRPDFDQKFDEVFSQILSPAISQQHALSKGFFPAARTASTDSEMIALWESFSDKDTPALSKAKQVDLARSVQTSVAEYDDLGFQRFVELHLSVKPMETLSTNATADFIYAKINHGFWEQLYTIFSDEIDPMRMRVKNREPHAGRYVDSGFIAPLTHLISETGHECGGKICFSPLYFGLSLGNGMMSHQDTLRHFEKQNNFQKRVNSGAAIGLVSFMNHVFPGKTIHADDGCFPKLGLSNKFLDHVLKEKLKAADRVIFAVPGHLDGIRLTVSDLPQDHILLSGTHVHEAWLGTLYRCARRILGSIWDGENVLVVTQSGVFSALLGLFLPLAKKRLNLDNQRLFFFDLGQVTDIANPESSGPWVKNHAPKRNDLFKILETG